MVPWTENQKLSVLCTGYGGNTVVFIFVAKEGRYLVSSHHYVLVDTDELLR